MSQMKQNALNLKLDILSEKNLKNKYMTNCKTNNGNAEKVRRTNIRRERAAEG